MTWTPPLPPCSYAGYCIGRSSVLSKRVSRVSCCRLSITFHFNRINFCSSSRITFFMFTSKGTEKTCHDARIETVRFHSGATRPEKVSATNIIVLEEERRTKEVERGIATCYTNYGCKKPPENSRSGSCYVASPLSLSSSVYIILSC